MSDADLVIPAGVRVATGCSSHSIDGPVASATLGGALTPAPTDAIAIDFEIDDLTKMRALARAVGADAGFSKQRTEDLTLVVSELASNGIRHGGPPRTLAIWHKSGVVTCEGRNRGELTDPLVGRRRPVPDQLSGRGIWIMRQLCDLVQIRTAQDRTVVRVTLS